MTGWGLGVPPWQNGNLYIALGRLHRCAQSPIFDRTFIHKWAVATTSMSMWGYGNREFQAKFIKINSAEITFKYCFPGLIMEQMKSVCFLAAKCGDFTCDLISVLTSFPRSGGLPQSSSRHEHWNMETTMKQPWWRLGIPLCYLILRTPPMYSQMIRWS